ncbi:hypothetical protein AA0119_g9709 [Alternaria tenuissima]|uniref:Uncharacterized protein n=1 Tax=Alternaria tenuissima TaxID=119927 RepID=A0ABY0FZ19_9PLEO|nr:hypothetical protein AA0119_g9709 [Alternaria tenuissima]
MHAIYELRRRFRHIASSDTPRRKEDLEQAICYTYTQKTELWRLRYPNQTVAAGPPVSATFSFGILILIASSLTLAGPRSCPFGTPAILEFLTHH